MVLPGTTFAEEEGTITTIEGRVVRCDQAVAPVPQRADIDVLRNLARRLGVGHHFDFVRGREVFEEMRTVSAGGPNDYAGITWERPGKACSGRAPTNGIPGHPGCTPNGSLIPTGWRGSAPSSSRRRLSWSTTSTRSCSPRDGCWRSTCPGNQTKRIPAQQRKAPGPYVELHPDPPRPRAGGGGPGGVAQPTGQIDRAVAVERSTPNQHRVHAVARRECNVFVAADLDPTSKIPGFKYTPISVSPLRAGELSGAA